MNKLLVWTKVEKFNNLEKVLKPALQDQGVFHQVVQFDKPPTVGAGDLLFTLGGDLVKTAQEMGILPKNRTIPSLREKLWPHGAGHVLVSYSPNMLAMDQTLEPDIYWDARLAVRYVKTGGLKPVVGKYQYVEHFNAVMREIKADWDAFGHPNAKVSVSLDLETIDTDPYHLGNDERPAARILTITMTVREGSSYTYIVPPDGKLPSFVWNQLKLIFESSKVKMIGANLKFDRIWMEVHWSLVIKNQTFDTFLVGSLLNENINNGLKTHAKMHTSMGGYETEFEQQYDKARMDVALAKDPAGFLTYAGGDTDACLRVSKVQKRELLKDAALTKFYMHVLQPAANAFVTMERRGVLVDVKQYDTLKTQVTAKQKELHAAALHFLPAPLKNKYKDNLSLTRDVIKRDLLFSEWGFNLEPLMMTEGGKDGKGKKEPSTSKDHLKYFIDHPDAGPFIKVLFEWGSAKKTLSTYITGFLKHLRSDGRFHPSYFLAHGDDGGTDTGRSSAKDPAYQTIPKHTIWAKPLRTVYVPPPGYAILKLDYSQGELRVAACVANEPTMLDVYAKGIDLHLKTGANLNGYTLEEALAILASKDEEAKKLIKKIRQGGKVGNFGLIYGMSAGGLMEFARTAYGVILTLQEAEAFRKVFFETYPELLKWHEKYRGLAHKNKFIRSPLGRMRHLPMIDNKNSELRAQAERQAVNSPIQGTLSDMGIWSIAILQEMYPDLWAFGFTHDEVQFYVPADDIEGWGRRIKDVMENLPFELLGWKPQLKFVAEAEYSTTNLAECEPLALAA